MAVILVIIASLTDFIDGKIARYLGQVSSWGQVFDPVADKLFELSLCTYFYFDNKLPIYYLGLLYLRNIAQLISIPLLGLLKISYKVKPSLIAKWGTAVVFILISILSFIKGAEIYLSSNEFEYLWFVREFIHWFVIPVSCLFELYILVTYLPRLIQILRGEHDTFN